MQCGTDTTVCGIQRRQSVRGNWNQVPDARSTQFERVLHVKMIVGNPHQIGVECQNTKFAITSKTYLNRKRCTWNFLVARDISHLILSKNMEFGMGHNKQRLLQAGFRNKLVAKLKSLDIIASRNMNL